MKKERSVGDIRDRGKEEGKMTYPASDAVGDKKPTCAGRVAAAAALRVDTAAARSRRDLHGGER